MNFLHRSLSKAFTLVELVIVISVIGILATIGVVSYNGYQNRARTAAAIDGANQVADLLEAYQLKNGGNYPVALTDAGITSSSVEYQYTRASDGKNYCVTATSKDVSYKMSQDAQPLLGACNGHGVNGVPAATNYALNPNAAGSSVAAFGYAGSPAAATRTIATDRYHDGTTSLKTVITAASGQTGAQAKVPTNGMRVNAGEKISWSFWIYSTKAGNIIPYLDASKVSDATYSGGASTTVAVPANVWTKITGQFTPTIDIYVTQIGGYNLAVVAGDTVWFDGFMVEKSATLHNFADGYSQGWAWSDPNAVNNSKSTGPPL